MPATLTDAEVKLLQNNLGMQPAKVAPAKPATAGTAVLQPSDPIVVKSLPPEVQADGLDPLLASILCTKRAHNSTGELAFVKWLYAHLAKLKCKVDTMAEGAVVATVGAHNKVLFSCHVDTVHNTTESDGSLQNIFFDEAFQHIFVAEKSKTTCLGADDGAGIYIMLKMIEAGVVGTYIFHRGEERGGISACAMKDKHADWLRKFDMCIAFDRPNDYEVIVTQGGQACASIDFGDQLVTALNAQGLNYEVSHKGVFTDSKVYRQLIPECINLGVGYYNQHEVNEYLDWTHISKMVKACIAIKWGTLKSCRMIVQEPAYEIPAKWRGQQNPTVSPFTQKNTTKTGTNGKGAKNDKPVEPPEPELDLDFETMTKEDIADYTCDEAMTGAIIRLIVDLDAERAKVTRLQYLLGL